MWIPSPETLHKGRLELLCIILKCLLTLQSLLMKKVMNVRLASMRCGFRHLRLQSQPPIQFKINWTADSKPDIFCQWRHPYGPLRWKTYQCKIFFKTNLKSVEHKLFFVLRCRLHFILGGHFPPQLTFLSITSLGWAHSLQSAAQAGISAVLCGFVLHFAEKANEFRQRVGYGMKEAVTLVHIKALDLWLFFFKEHRTYSFISLLELHWSPLAKR